MSNARHAGVGFASFAGLMGAGLVGCSVPAAPEPALLLGSTAQAMSAEAIAAESPSSWPLASADVRASGTNRSERVLARDNVQGLELKWSFDATRAGHYVAPIHATPVVDAQGNAYVGDLAGTFYAVGRDGRLLWSALTEPPSDLFALLISPGGPPPPATPIFGAAALAPDGSVVVFADGNARLYAHDRRTGAELWRAALDSHPLGGVQANSVSIVAGTVLVGIAGSESSWPALHAAGVPGECCSHSGALVAVDLESGRELWRYQTIARVERLPPSFAPFTLGPSGAGIWAQPTYDEQSDTVYVGTGQNFTPGPDGRSSPTSDAIIALDFCTGEPRWVHQFTADDIWVSGVLNPDPATGKFLDADVGDAPKVYRLENGRKVVAAGQKDGRFHVLDAETGELIRSTQQLTPANSAGGFQGGSAVAGGVVFEHGQHATGVSGCLAAECLEGRVLALSEDGARVRWSFATPGVPLLGGVALANQVLFFQSPVAEPAPFVMPPQWALHALDARTGAELLRLPFSGRAVTAPAVAGGRVYIGTGNALISEFGLDLAGTLIQLGLREEP